MSSTNLINAASDGNISAVKYELYCGADVNVGNKHNNTPLMLAAYGGHTEIVRLLLDNNPPPIDVDATSSTSGNTALMLAAIKGHAEIVSMLLDFGADIDIISKYRKTAVIEAAKYGHAEIVDLLMEAGAYVDMRQIPRNCSFFDEMLKSLEVVV